jgi:hypothetical protein
MRILAILAIVGLTGATPSWASNKAVEVPLASYYGALDTVSVLIHGQSVPFLLDTGGGGTILTPETAAKAGLTPFGQWTGMRFDGEKLTAQRCGVVTLRVGGVDFQADAGVLDLSVLGLQGVGGILALQSFEGSAITLDLAGNRLILETPATLKRRVSDMRELTVRPGRECAGASLDLYVRALAPTGDLWLEMDCGNLQPVLLAPHAYKQLGVSAPGDSTGPLRLELAGAGPETFQAKAVDMIYDGLLNSAYFRQHLVTFDLKSMRAWESPRAATP